MFQSFGAEAAIEVIVVIPVQTKSESGVNLHKRTVDLRNIVTILPILAFLTIAASVNLAPNAYAVQETLDIEDARAALEQHSLQRPNCQFEIFFRKSMPDKVENAENVLKSFDLAASTWMDDSDPRRQLRTILAEQAASAQETVASSAVIRFRETDNRLLMMGTMISGDRALDDPTKIFSMLPTEFDPQRWRVPLPDRIRLEIREIDGTRIDYVHDDALGSYQWIHVDSTGNEESVLVNTLRNLTYTSFGVPFEIRFAGKSCIASGFSAFLNDPGTVRIDEATGNWEITSFGPEVQMKFSGAENRSVSRRTETRVVLSPAHGYLPLTIKKTHQFFDNGEPVRCHKDWNQHGEFWTITHRQCGEYFYPYEIEYARLTPSTARNTTIASWKSAEEYLDILRAPASEDIDFLCVQRCYTQVRNLVFEKDAPLLPSEFHPPANASVFDRVNNTVSIRPKAREALKIAFDKLPEGVIAPEQPPPTSYLGRRFVICAILVGFFAAFMIWGGKKAKCD